MKLTGAQIIMECLLEQGVNTIFGYPGGAVLNIYDAIYEYRDRIIHITTAHEQAASHAADGYARASGKTGVCIATSGPGATNLVTGLATAFMDSSPIVAITGNVNRDLLGKQSFQEVPISEITAPITKKSSIVMKVEDLAKTIREAFILAQSGRKGPVLIDIPKDITGETCEFIPKPKEEEHLLPYTNEDAINQAMQLLEKSQRPFVYAGGGVIASHACPELKEFVNKLDAPISSSLMCQGGYDQTDPRYIGMLGMHGTQVSSLAVKECDLFIAVGTRFSDRVTCNANLFARHCPMIQIDIDRGEFGKNIPVDVSLQGEAKSVLEALNQRLCRQNHTKWMDQIGLWKKEHPPIVIEKEETISPQLVMDTLSKLTGDNAFITTEVGQHQMWAAQYFTYRFPRQLISSGGLGTMGFGLGAAIGAKLANPEKKVVNIAGDGSFHMNANELSTLAKYQIPIVELIFNNEVLGMVRQWQKLFYGSRFSETTLEKPTNYERLAEAYGIKTLTISRPQEAEEILEKALSMNQPVLVNCLIGKDRNVLPMVPAGGSVEDPIFEME